MERVATVIVLEPLACSSWLPMTALDQRSAFNTFSASGQGSCRLPDFIRLSDLKASSTISSWFSIMAHSSPMVPMTLTCSLLATIRKLVSPVSRVQASCFASASANSRCDWAWGRF